MTTKIQKAKAKAKKQADAISKMNKNLKKIKVTLGGEDFNAYTLGDIWNGFQCPYFTKTEGMKVIKDLDGDGLRYDGRMDAFVEFDSSDPKNKEYWNVYKKQIINGKSLYPIGYMGWTWELA
jgi:hypothetical protein